MQTRFDRPRYGQRWQVETAVSMIKRRPGAVTTGRTYWSRRRDLMLMALTHNIMILWRIEVFYTATPARQTRSTPGLPRQDSDELVSGRA